jgi:DNA-binding NarL/FixJ family response regulator
LRGIVLSNYATPQHVKASADAGAEYFLDKSAEFEKIGDILAAILAASTLSQTKHHDQPRQQSRRTPC